MGDKRHLYLIADHMTHRGGYRPFNRTGMRDEPSPALQMSFESTTTFLTSAAVRNLTDTLTSPAGAVICGKLPPVGTGACAIVMDNEFTHAEKKDRKAAADKKFVF